MTEDQNVWFLGAEFSTEARAEGARDVLANLPVDDRALSEPYVIDLGSNYFLLLDVATSAWLVAALTRAKMSLLAGITEDLETRLHEIEPEWRVKYLNSRGEPSADWAE